MFHGLKIALALEGVDLPRDLILQNRLQVILSNMTHLLTHYVCLSVVHPQLINCDIITLLRSFLIAVERGGGGCLIGVGR